MVKDTAFYELFASYKVPNHEQVGYWVDLKSNPRGEVIRVYNNNTRSWTKITEGLPDIVNGSPFKSKREDGTYRKTGLYDDPGDVNGILTELFEAVNSDSAVIKISQELYDKIKKLAEEQGIRSANADIFIYDALTTTNLLSDVGGDCAIKIIYSNGEIHIYYNVNTEPYRTIEVVTLFDIDVNLHVNVQSIQNGVITEGIISLLSSGDGTKYLNDAGEYETVNEVYIGSVEPTGNEEIWINPDEDYNISSVGLVEEAPLDNKLHARKNGQWVEFIEENTDLSLLATKADLETKVDEAPTDDKQYARKNGQWFEVTSGEVLDVTELTTLYTQTPDEEGLYTISSELYNKVMSVDTMTCNKAIIGEGEHKMSYNILWYVASDDTSIFRYLTLQSYGLSGEVFMAIPFIFTTEYPNKVLWNVELGVTIAHRSDGKGDEFLSDDGTYKAVSSSPLVNEEYGKIVIDAMNNQTITQDNFDKLKNALTDTTDSLFCEVYAEGIGTGQLFLIATEQGIAVYAHVQMSNTSFAVSNMVQVVEIKNDLTVEFIGGEVLNLTSSGDGTKFLSDDGEYKTVEAGLPEAPTDTIPYVRKDNEWVNMHNQYENEDIAILIMDIFSRETNTITQEEYDRFVTICPVGEVAFASSHILDNLFTEGGSNKNSFKIVNSSEDIRIYVNTDYAFYFGHQSSAIIINSDLSYEFLGAYGYIMPQTNTDTGERLLSLFSTLSSPNESQEAYATLISGGDGTKFLSNSGEYFVPNRLESSNTPIELYDKGNFGYVQMTLKSGDLITFTKSPNLSLRPAGNSNNVLLGDTNARWKELHVTDIYAYGNIHSDGKLILNSDTFTTEDLLTYGVKWEVNGTNPVLTRIGSDNLHRTLPIQSKMRGCTLADDGTVNHYFNNDWTANTDGTAIVKDGSDGMVMIEIPEHYVKYEVVDGYNTIRLSEIALAGYTKVDKQYISAYEATVDRTDSTKLKLSSVVNNSVEFRGGTNNSSWDSGENTLLGKPLTNTSRANFRTYARNRGNENEYYWNMYDFIAHNTLYTLYIVEYANLNSQLAVNNTLTSNGYKQGGLGNGVTNLNGTAWNTFNSYNPVIPCGHSDSLGNNSGEVAYTMPASYGTLTTYVNRYRGVENPFGHIWKNTDGAIFDIKTDADGGTSTIYIATDPEKYKDSVDEGYTAIGELPRTEGYGKSLHLGTFFPSAVGGSSTTGLCDYFYTSISSSSLRTCLMGGRADRGALAGFAYVNSSNSVGYASAPIGSRLIFRK